MKKIDTYYRTTKGDVFYLHSTNSFKTCKAAAESAKQIEGYRLKILEAKVGEPINKDRIFSRFDNNWTRYDNQNR